MEKILKIFQLNQCLISGKIEILYKKIETEGNEDILFDLLLELSSNESFLVGYPLMGYNFTKLCAYLVGQKISDENRNKLYRCVENYNKISRVDKITRESYEINEPLKESQLRNLKPKRLVAYDDVTMYKYIVKDYDILNCLLNNKEALVLFDTKYILATISNLINKYTDEVIIDERLFNSIDEYLSKMIFDVKFKINRRVDKNLFTKTCEDFDTLLYQKENQKHLG